MSIVSSVHSWRLSGNLYFYKQRRYCPFICLPYFFSENYRWWLNSTDVRWSSPASYLLEAWRCTGRWSSSCVSAFPVLLLLKIVLLIQNDLTFNGQITCGSLGLSTATVKLINTDGQEHIACSVGTGPVDAAYKAVDLIVKVLIQQKTLIKLMVKNCNCIYETSIRYTVRVLR